MRPLFILTWAGILLLTGYSAAATWTTSAAGSAPISTRPVICSDSLGHLHVAWTSDSYIGEKLNYATNQQGQWDYQKNLAGGSSNPAYVPVITADEYGFAYVIARMNVSKIQYGTNREKTSMSWWYNIPSMSSGHFHEVSIEVAGDDTVHIFAEGDHEGWGTVYHQRLYTPVQVIPGGTSAFYSTAVDQDNVVHFAGSHSDAIKYSSFSGGAWSAAVEVDGLVTATGQPSITCDDSGNLHVVFIETSTGHIYYIHNTAGSWGSPVMTTGSGVFPHIVIDENGCAHVAYHTKPDPGNICYMNNIGGSWSAPENLATINTDISGTEDAAHVGSKIALDLRSSTVNIVYIQNDTSVTVAQTGDYELRRSKSTDISSTLTLDKAAPETDTLSTSATGTVTLMEFTVSDVAGDGVPTKIQELVFQRASGTTDNKGFNDYFQSMTIEVSDVTSYVCSVYAYKVIAGTPEAVWKSIPEGGSLGFTLKGTLNDPLDGVTDKTVQLTINGLYDVIIDTTGSRFAYTCANIYSDTLLFKLNDFEGSGTEADPYLISDLDDLKILSEENDYMSYHFKQTADIDASATSGWNGGYGFQPIGYPSPLSGSYDGDGHTIDGLFIDRSSESNVGFFSQTNGPVKNLTLTNVDITGYASTGGLGGTISGLTTHCHTSGSVTGEYCVGGLAGFNNDDILNCSSSASVAAKYGQAGGLTGYNWGSTVQNCYSTGDVTRVSGGSGTEYGGFCGRNYNGTVENSYSTGSVIYSGGTNPTDKGFIGGESTSTSASYANNFFDSTASGQTSATQTVSAAAAAKNTAEMKMLATFSDVATAGLTTAWDFVDNPNDDSANNNFWDMDTGGIIYTGYPYLTSQCHADTEAVSASVTLFFNEGDGDTGDGHDVNMFFNSVTGTGSAMVQQAGCTPANAPCLNPLDVVWNLDTGSGISAFNADLTFYYSDSDVSGYTESSAFLGIAKFNASTNTWTWLGGTVDAGANTITVNGVTSFSDFALFRRIFGDCTGDGYVDASDLQRLGDCWHDTNSGEFTGGSDARFFNFNKNTDSGNQIIDAADLQVFGDCWHNGVVP